ncbi:MAG TPA: S-methyl-5-thioribose-1-phosphate isomerase [Firmicutes bacterium]|uniref:Methylthioribose-1-phosphate isomerase n=1 Tax=Capillibacterium thermochitinicola TaxID=2699427 RepID=A0A8J6LIW3_9FIRM|nr:S-methyl-5-thioribose-1-phosphate isomerase [Capillibacterium thermochitinicola]MBA2133111.1 S-methyl-5-thioribose-1-phosphate isomerase [Capillibacterium thermochitinicola]HHW11951.1 S-methyl-5-thioribose-1-phosphate isomerase [Bacillota bacterium]
MGETFATLRWEERSLILLDQTQLPEQEVYLTCQDYRAVAEAIRRLAVRGAPAIGIAGAFGVVLGAYELVQKREEDFFAGLEAVFTELAGTRPTAVNLFWALDRMKKVVAANRDGSPEAVAAALETEALRLYQEDIEANRRLGAHGAALLTDGMTVLTICNAGALATVAHGTALAVIRAAVQEGKRLQVVACETRPLLQGARLTTWELMKDGIPVTLITDNMAGYLMQQGRIQAVITGADRIAANGDVVNKIGTYTLAVLAHAHGIPFYVAAPLSTFDLTLPDGQRIPIEERAAEEVTSLRGHQIAPAGVTVYNPAFDLTPARFVRAWITEKGVIRNQGGKIILGDEGLQEE